MAYKLTGKREDGKMVNAEIQTDDYDEALRKASMHVENLPVLNFLVVTKIPDSKE